LLTPCWDFIEFEGFAVQLRYDFVQGDEVIDRGASLLEVQDLVERIKRIIKLSEG
jgi:hypothetical protein